MDGPARRLSSNHQRVAHTGRNKELGARRTRWYWRLRRVREGIRRRFGGIWIREWLRNWVRSVSPSFQIRSRRQPSACIIFAANYRTGKPLIQANPLGELYYCSCASHALPSISRYVPLHALRPSCGFWVANWAFFIWCRISRIWLVGRLAHRRLPIPSGRLDRWFFRVVGRLTAGCLAFAIDLRLSSSMWFDRHKLFRSSDSSVAIYVGDDVLTAVRASSLAGHSGHTVGSRTCD